MFQVRRRAVFDPESLTALPWLVGVDPAGHQVAIAKALVGDGAALDPGDAFGKCHLLRAWSVIPRSRGLLQLCIDPAAQCPAILLGIPGQYDIPARGNPARIGDLAWCCRQVGKNFGRGRYSHRIPLWQRVFRVEQMGLKINDIVVVFRADTPCGVSKQEFASFGLSQSGGNEKTRENLPMQIELKNIKHAAFASEETNCYRASLYVDGKKIGEVSNEGRGGPDRFQGDTAAFARADEWCRTNLPKWSLPEFSDKEYETDLEHHFGSLLETWQYTRDYKRAIKTKVLLIYPDKPGVYEIKHRGQAERIVEKLQAQHPGIRILNTLPLDEAVALFRSA